MSEGLCVKGERCEVKGLRDIRFHLSVCKDPKDLKNIVSLC